jgi:hypothetical protein
MMRSDVYGVAVVVGALLLLSCADGLAPGEQVEGQWGTHGELPANFRATADSVILRLPCAAARFAGPIDVDANGEFGATGEFYSAGFVMTTTLGGATEGSSLRLRLTFPEFTDSIDVHVRQGLNPSFRDAICPA